MNTTMTGKSLLDTLAASLSALLSGLLEELCGPAVHRPVVGSVSAADLSVLLCLVGFVLLVNGLAASYLRRKLRQAGAHPESRAWRVQLWRTVGPPLYLLIWVYGVYLAATPILMKLSSDQGPHPVRELFDRLFDVGVFAVLFWLFFKVTHVLEAFLKEWAGPTSGKLGPLVVPVVGRSLRVIVPVLGLIFALPMIGLPPESAGVLAKGSSILIIGVVAYLLFQAVGLGEKAALARYDITAADNLEARKVYTQVHVLSKTLYVIIAVFTVASMLMLFEEVRRFGTSLLASAGVVGIVVGFAAQRTIANLFAGFQLALTQPIRLDDVVIVEGEWGRIEEITLTYVVVRIWDDRRLVVPLSHFIEQPFQNWTRVSADILGSVFVWADYTLPIAEVRPAVQRIVESCKDWDRRFWNLQVTDTNERAMQLRVLATAADASKAWNLRCEIREKLLALLQQQYPHSLPRMRAALDQTPPAPA
ncbi:MAG: mechanosensitive ion channel [Verrucomicrobia bacterium]|nr:mechanosensitive ion channel [Verrucomicrobiota bacterium]